MKARHGDVLPGRCIYLPGGRVPKIPHSDNPSLYTLNLQTDDPVVNACLPDSPGLDVLNLQNPVPVFPVTGVYGLFSDGV